MALKTSNKNRKNSPAIQEIVAPAVETAAVAVETFVDETVIMLEDIIHPSKAKLYSIEYPAHLTETIDKKKFFKLWGAITIVGTIILLLV